jgi:hypothetical protein
VTRLAAKVPKAVKSQHRVKKHHRDILVLDDNSVWRLDAYGALKASFWAEADELEAEDSVFRGSNTNVKRGETVKAQKIYP